MRFTHRTGALLLLAAAIATGTASAQSNAVVAYSCPVTYNVADSVAFAARQVVEIRTPYGNSMELAVQNQFGPRVRGQYSRSDMQIRNRVSADGFFGTVVQIRNSLDEAKEACMKTINRLREEGYTLYGVGSPIYNGRSEETVREFAFLSILEYPNYIPGTVASRAARGGLGDPQGVGDKGASQGGNSGGSGPVNEWGRTPAQEASFRQSVALVRANQKLLQQADSLFAEGDYAGAKRLWGLVLGSSDRTTDQIGLRAKIKQADELLAMQQYANFTRSTGISFGVNGGSSYFQRDGGLLGIGVARSTFGLNAFYGIGMALTSISDAVYDNPDAAERLGEFTRYQVRAGINVPKLHLGSFGLRAGYIYQRTDKRALHLGLAGIRYGDASGLSMHADVIPIYGKMTYGFGIDMNFSK